MCLYVSVVRALHVILRAQDVCADKKRREMKKKKKEKNFVGFLVFSMYEVPPFLT